MCYNEIQGDKCIYVTGWWSFHMKLTVKQIIKEIMTTPSNQKTNLFKLKLDITSVIRNAGSIPWIDLMVSGKSFRAWISFLNESNVLIKWTLSSSPHPNMYFTLESADVWYFKRNIESVSSAWYDIDVSGISQWLEQNGIKILLPHK